MVGNNTTLSFGNVTVAGTDTTAAGILYLVTSLLVMISNGTVIIVVVLSRELHLPTLWNIAFMALCDFSYGLHYLVFAVPSAFLNHFAYSERFIVQSSCLFTLMHGQNILNIVVATVDRYLCVCWPLKYPTLMTARNFVIAVVLTVIINVCRLCIIVLPKVDVYYNVDIALTLARFPTLAKVVSSLGLPALSLLIIFGILLKIIQELSLSRRRTYPGPNQRKPQQFTVTMCLSATVFCLSHLPLATVLAWNLKSGADNIPLSFIRFGVLCLLSNSLWNVVIYAAVYKPFWRAFLRVFCLKYYRRQRQMDIHVLS